MLSHQIFAVLAAAEVAAFMVPPNVALNEVSKPALSDVFADPFSMKLFVACKSCPYAEFSENGVSWTENTDSSLFLDIAVNNDPNTLELNGVQIYPPPLPLPLSIDPEVPSIAQVPSTVSIKDVEKNPTKYLSHPLRLTSWGMETTTIHSLKETGEEIIKIELFINALEGKAIKIPDIVITALKNPEVKLMVLNVELQKSQQVSNDCNGLPILCKWKSVIGGWANSIKGNTRPKCHKTRPHVSAAEQHKEEDLKKPHRRPHYKGHHKEHGKEHKEQKGHKDHFGHHGHHGRYRLHRIMHKVAHALLNIFIPLLLGVVAGMLTYTFGMLLGTFIAIMWIRFKGKRNNYQPIALQDDEEEPRESFEKDEFQEEEYCDSPPIYVEVEGKEVNRPE